MILAQCSTRAGGAGRGAARNGVVVSSGSFNARLDFGAAPFTGEARWLQAAVKCPGDEGFVLFNTRQELTPAPYAISLVPGATVRASTGTALRGLSDTGDGLRGESRTRVGVFGKSTDLTGTHGQSVNASGVAGFSENAVGVYGQSTRGEGVRGVANVDNRAAVVGHNNAGGAGVFGYSVRGDGAIGIAVVDNRSGVAGINEAGGAGIYGYSARGYAGDFNGKVRVKVLEITGGADLAEPFPVRAAAGAEPQPGMVVCIDSQNPGALVICAAEADHTVAGVISGAGGVQPGLVMRQSGTLADGEHPIALTGRVYVWVDATEQPVTPGDLLTTSALPGHAQHAGAEAQGALIGKAMTGLADGKGLVLVLVSLQ